MNRSPATHIHDLIYWFDHKLEICVHLCKFITSQVSEGQSINASKSNLFSTQSWLWNPVSEHLREFYRKSRWATGCCPPFTSEKRTPHSPSYPRLVFCGSLPHRVLISLSTSLVYSTLKLYFKSLHFCKAFQVAQR